MTVTNKKILIVGSNSFLAWHLIAALHESNYIIGIYNKNKNNLSDKIINFSTEEINTLQTEFDIVFIVAAYIPNNYHQITEKLYESNILLITKIVNRFNNSKIVYCSSVAVYGDPSNRIISERSYSVEPSEYGISKIWAETIVKSNCKQFSIVRISSMYGINMKMDTYIPRIILNSIKNKEIEVWGKGERLQNYIHVEKVVEFLIQSSITESNNIYLATSGQSISNYELALFVAHETNATVKLGGEDLSASAIYQNNDSCNQLGINNESIEDLKENIKKIIEWIRTNAF